MERKSMNKLKFSLQPDTGTLSDGDAKRYFSWLGMATCVMMVAYFGSSVALSFLIHAFAPSLLGNAWVYSLLSTLPLYGIGFSLFWLLLRRLPRDGAIPETLSGTQWLQGLCITFAMMMAGSYVGTIIIAVFETVLRRSLTNPVESATVGQSVWVNLFFVALLAPVLEELVFRKLLCDRLLPLGEGYAVVLSAAIFGLVHGNFFQFFYAFALGAFFAIIYVKTGRIRYTIFYHIIVNLLGGVLAPWILERIEPVLNEEWLTAFLEVAEQGDPNAILTMLQPYFVPLILLLAYELFIFVTSILGVVFVVQGFKKIRFRAGLLPPPKKNRVGNVLLTGGVCAAIAVFSLIFILSLL